MSNRHSYERYEIPDIKGRKHAVVLFSENRSVAIVLLFCSYVGIIFLWGFYDPFKKFRK